MILTTNSLFALALTTESFSTGTFFPSCARTELIAENMIIGGSELRALKKLYGDTLTILPSGESDETRAMGRGTIPLTVSSEQARQSCDGVE